MDERSAKRARQGEGGIAGADASVVQLVGCHLDVNASTAYIFLGQIVDVEVRLLNDEDVLQHTTVDINVSLTGGDKVEYGRCCRRQCLESLICVGCKPCSLILVHCSVCRFVFCAFCPAQLPN